MTTGGWRKSRFSGNGADCVEVAPAGHGALLRDTKDNGRGPVLTLAAEQWTAFLHEVQDEIPSRNGAVTVDHTSQGVSVRAGASGVTLVFTESEWAAFRAGVRDGEFTELTV